MYWIFKLAKLFRQLNIECHDGIRDIIQPNVWVNSKSDHPSPGQTPGYLTFLKMISRSNAPLVGDEKSKLPQFIR